MVFEAEPLVDPARIPRMRMPFEAGVAVLCSQGNASDPGRTHALPQNRHALDFSNRVLPEVTIVAAASGTVAYAVTDVVDEPRGGAGYGNQVRVLHENGLFTLYAHLEQVFVQVGDAVTMGQRLGTMGHTGLAGDRHLHFSLHSGVYAEDGVPPTIEIPEIVTFDAAISSGDFRCSSKADPWSGSIYAPEASPDGEEATRTAIAELEDTVTRRSRLHRYSNANPYVTVGTARRFLQPILAEAPDELVAHYGWAVEVEIPLNRFQAAESHLARAERALDNPAVNEPWIMAWIENQRGAMAFGQAHWEEGEAHFARAAALLHHRTIREFAQRQRARAGVKLID
jgi:hypothetical protein